MSLEKIRLVDHPAGRLAMKGWLVRLPSGDKAVIESVEPGAFRGHHDVVVKVRGILATYPAHKLKTL